MLWRGIFASKNAYSTTAGSLPAGVVWGMVADSPSNNVWAKSSPRPRAAIPIRNKVKDIIHYLLWGLKYKKIGSAPKGCLTYDLTRKRLKFTTTRCDFSLHDYSGVAEEALEPTLASYSFCSIPKRVSIEVNITNKITCKHNVDFRKCYEQDGCSIGKVLVSAFNWPMFCDNLEFRIKALRMYTIIRTNQKYSNLY